MSVELWVEMAELITGFEVILTVGELSGPLSVGVVVFSVDVISDVKLSRTVISNVVVIFSVDVVEESKVVILNSIVLLYCVVF